MSNKQEAKHLLTYYFRLIAKRAGVNWNSDNDAEIEQIIDAIFDEIKDTTIRHNEIVHDH